LYKREHRRGTVAGENHERDGSYRALITADDPHLRIDDRVTVEADRIYFR